jgi:hypothetical protein
MQLQRTHQLVSNLMCQIRTAVSQANINALCHALQSTVWSQLCLVLLLIHVPAVVISHAPEWHPPLPSHHQPHCTKAERHDHHFSNCSCSCSALTSWCPISCARVAPLSAKPLPFYTLTVWLQLYLMLLLVHSPAGVQSHAPGWHRCQLALHQ